MALDSKALAANIRADYEAAISKTKKSPESEKVVFNKETNSFETVTIPPQDIPDPPEADVFVNSFMEHYDAYAMSADLLGVALVSNPSLLTFSNAGNSPDVAVGLGAAVMAWWMSQVIPGEPDVEAAVTAVVPAFPDLAANISTAILAMVDKSGELEEENDFEDLCEIIDKEVKKIQYVITEVTPSAPPKITVYNASPA